MCFIQRPEVAMLQCLTDFLATGKAGVVIAFRFPSIFLYLTGLITSRLESTEVGNHLY